MTPVTRKVRVKVPATSANLGSGFDTVGLALDYHDDLEFTLSADPVNTAAQVMIEGEGEDTLPRDETRMPDLRSGTRRIHSAGAQQHPSGARHGFLRRGHRRRHRRRGSLRAGRRPQPRRRVRAGRRHRRPSGQRGPGRVRRTDHVLGHGDRGRRRLRADSGRRADAQRLPHHQLPRGGRSDRGRVRAGLRAVHRKGPSGVAD